MCSGLSACGMETSRSECGASGRASSGRQSKALGAGFAVVKELAQRVTLAAPLQHLGLGRAVGMPSLDIAHPAVLNDDSIAEWVMGLTLATMARRLASHMVYSHGVPEVFAGLLDAHARPQLLLWLVEVHQAWQVVKRRKEQRWAKIIDRSLFNLVVWTRRLLWSSRHP